MKTAASSPRSHFRVSEVLFGSGEAEKLVEMAVRQIKDAGGSVSASCPFARKYLKEHPDLAR